MSCGFGAVILIFLIIDHNSEVHAEEVNVDLISEVSLLEEEILEGRENLVKKRNIIDEIELEVVEADGLAERVQAEKRELEQELASLDEASIARIEHLNQLKTEIQNLEEQTRKLKAQENENKGENVRQFVGDGDRQYLTGLKLGGDRTLIALDTSASMLHRNIVNIIRMRNMSDSDKRKSEKWTQAISIAEWLIAQLPPESEFQLYTFNTEAKSAVLGSKGEWLAASNTQKLDQAATTITSLVPENGTSLENLFVDIAKLSPRPDNIILITDGLPTQGRKIKKGSVSGSERMRIYNRAVSKLPTGIPVNVILTPLEGDPLAASAFWKLSIATRGAFIAPSRDWP